MAKDHLKAPEVLAKNGLGHPSSAVAQAFALFDGAVYLGASAPRASTAEDAARIFRHLPDGASWTPCYTAAPRRLDAAAEARLAARRPLADATGAPETLAEAFGITCFAPFEGKGDGLTRLYAGTASLFGPGLLRSGPGGAFEDISAPPFAEGDIATGALQSFQGRLYAAPRGEITAEIDEAAAPRTARLYASDDPADPESWQQASRPGFGTDLPGEIVALCATHGHLYAATACARKGFALWRTEGGESLPHNWTQVLEAGAFRFAQNMMAASLCAFGDHLYIGTGIPGLGAARTIDVAEAAPELLRIAADGTWDVVVGTTRISPDGLKVPLSAQGPGFDDPFNAAISALVEHDGALYAGTQNWAPYAAIHAGEGVPLQGGFQLWRSLDGESWEPVLDEGAGEVTETGIRAMISTEAGLWIGTERHTPLMRLIDRMAGGARTELAAASTGFSVLKLA
ncbi:hypothetical protein [Roseivivax halotolerans]|nr:hypothetical protein [Roseivivax halotolerans]